MAVRRMHDHARLLGHNQQMLIFVQNRQRQILRQNIVGLLQRHPHLNPVAGRDLDADIPALAVDSDAHLSQLQPGYNVQMATENQFILFYSLHQRPTDTRCFMAHMEQLAASSLPMPQTVIADAGYGSEENYLYAVGEDKEPRFDFLIPYGSYMKEKTRRYKKDIRHASNWVYEELNDRFVCPNGRYVRFTKYQTKKNASGLEQSFKMYECEDCRDCPFKASCTRAKGNRQVHWNTIGEGLKAKAKKALEDDKKSAIYARCKVEVESVFGHIKGNRSFRRFSLRGLEKVHTEFGIVALAHNLLKVAGVRLAIFLHKQMHIKSWTENMTFFRPTFYFGDLLDSPSRDFIDFTKH